MKKILLISSFLLVLFITSCNTDNKPRNFDYGKVVDNKYINTYFNFEINLPAQWVVQSQEQINNLSQKGKDLFAGDNKNMKAILNASEINTANLMAVFQYEVGSAVEFNPSFILVAENLKGFPGIKDGKNYLYHSKKLLKQSQLQYENLDVEPQKIVINKQVFHFMEIYLNYSGLKITQGYYSTIKNDFSLTAIISYINEEQKVKLMEILNSIEFKN